MSSRSSAADTVLDSAPAAGSTSCRPAYGVDVSVGMLALVLATAAQAEVTNAVFVHRRIDDIPLPGRPRRCGHLQLRRQPDRRQAPRAAEAFRVPAQWSPARGASP